MSEELPIIVTTFSLSSWQPFDVRAVAERIPLAPTTLEVAGTPRPVPRPAVKFSSWLLRSEERRTQSIEEEICRLIAPVLPHKEAIVGVMADFGLAAQVESYVRVYSGTRRAIYSLSPKVMQEMSALQATWNMALYDYSVAEE